MLSNRNSLSQELSWWYPHFRVLTFSFLPPGLQMNLPGKKEDLETNNGGFSSAQYSVIQKMGYIYIFENVNLIF